MTQAAKPTLREELGQLQDEALNDHFVLVERLFKIRDRRKDMGFVDFRLNRVQQDYRQTRTSRDVYLKARQVTISSIVQADITAMSMLHPGLDSFIIVQTPEGTNLPPHRARVEAFVESVPAQMRPTIKVSNTHHVQFGFKGEPDSNIYFASAGSEDIARGGTIYAVHVTEFGVWKPEEADMIMTALMGLPTESRVIAEGTPRGASGPMFNLYGESRRGEGDFKTHFYPWFWEESYQTKDHKLRMEDLTGHEARLVSAHNLSLDQIAWRRFMIRRSTSVAAASGYELSEDAKEAAFLQEYAEDDVTCFLTSGFPVFDTIWLRKLLDESCPPFFTRGHLRIWEPPIKGEVYVVGGDPAEGLANSDNSAAIVRNARSWKHVATLRGKIAPRAFAGELAEVGAFYNNALVNPARINHGHLVIDVMDTDLRYAHIYTHMKGIAIAGGDDRLGFPEGPITKPLLVAEHQHLINSRFWQSRDRELIEEHLRYQETEGKFGGEHDDLVAGDMMCTAARSQALVQRGINAGPRVLKAGGRYR